MRIKVVILSLFLLYLISCNASSDGTSSASSSAEPSRESKGLNTYIGIWQAQFPNNDKVNIIVESEENVLYNDLKALNIEDLGNDKYKMNIPSDNAFSIILKFKSDTEGTIEDDNLGIGVLKKE